MKISSNIHCLPIRFKGSEKKENPQVGGLYAAKISMIQDAIASFDEIQKAYFIAQQNIEKQKEAIKINTSVFLEKPQDLSDTKEFAKYFEYKIAKNLKYKSREDIEQLVENISQKTNADKNLVLDVLIRLTQFSSYADLKEFSNELDKEKIDIVKLKDLGLPLSLCSVITYVGIWKNQIKTSRDSNKEGILIDDQILEELRKIKKNKSMLWSIVNNDYSSGELKFLAIDGWNFKKDGKNLSYSMFGQNVSLENLAQEVINKMQKENLSLDEALNGDVQKELNEIFGKEIEIKFLKNNKKYDDKIDKILNQINPIMPDRSLIYSVINRVAETKSAGLRGSDMFCDDKIRNKKKNLAQYLDYGFVGYSAETLNDALVEKHNQLKELLESINKSVEDVVYYIPEKGKSFDLVTYQYLKANNLDFENVVVDSLGRYTNPKLENKVIVVLDDFSGTGQSLIETSFNYEKFIKTHENSNVVFAPILLFELAERSIKRQIKGYNREGKDFILKNKNIPFSIGEKNKLDNESTIEFSRLLDGFGYYNNASCVSFPYSCPDNNSGFGLLFAQYFLPYKNVSNKMGIFGNFGANTELYGVDADVLLRLINLESKEYKD